MVKKQIPSNPDNWLYQIQGEKTCVFSKLVFLGVNAQEWDECDEASKIKWELEHPILEETIKVENV